MNRATRWRLILGDSDEEQRGQGLSGDLKRMDQALSQLYETDPNERKGGLGGSSPRVARWLGDIREYFPSSVVKVLQQDAMDRLGLQQLLVEPEVLNSVEPDVNLVATLLSLKNLIPSQTRETAREVIRGVVEDLQKRLQTPMTESVKGALHRGTRNFRPKLREIDWHRTIRRNLKHYQPDYHSIIPESLVGYGRKGAALKDVILAIDQSGSMATSVVYASVFGAVLASLPSLNTRLIAFDTSVADLSQQMEDPVDLLFGVQLGGGTDIHRALTYAQEMVIRPQDTILILITDLFEGGNRYELLRVAEKLKQSGVTLITLLALNDQGKPFFDQKLAHQFRGFDIPTFACTPDHFPAIMADALAGREIRRVD